MFAVADMNALKCTKGRISAEVKTESFVHRIPQGRKQQLIIQRGIKSTKRIMQASFPACGTLQALQGDPAREYRHHIAQSNSAFEIDRCIRTSRTTDAPNRKDNRAAIHSLR